MISVAPAPTSAATLPGERLYPGALIAGRYGLERLIANGGMSTVWAATDHGADAGPRPVAIKLMSAKCAGDAVLAERFRREALIGRSLTGPQFARTFADGVHDGLSYIVMERLEGEDLAARLKRFGRMSPGECLTWLAELARGLEEAHAAGVVHRDLSPRNLFFARDRGGETLKILDFGIAVSPVFRGRSNLTEPGKVVGSIHYLAPEQLRGGVVDARTDMWAMAVLLYRAVTGVRPFDGTGMQPLAAIICDAPTPPSHLLPGLLPELDAFFRRALSKDPADRYPSLAAFVHAFLQAAIGTSAPSLAAPRVPSDSPTRKIELPSDFVETIPMRRPGRMVAVMALAVPLAAAIAALALR